MSERHLRVALSKVGERVAIRIEATVLPALSHLLPGLHNMGLFVERQVGSDSPVHLAGASVSELVLDADSSKRLQAIKDQTGLNDLLSRLFTGEAEDGRLNGLAIVAGLSVRQIMLVRTYASYLRQAGLRFSLSYMAESLRRYPDAIRTWTEIFDAKFNPRRAAATRAADVAAKREQFQNYVAAIVHPDSEEVLRKLDEVLDATVRTSYYINWQAYQLPDYIAIKICGEKINFLPRPRPYREIFVLSPRFHAVHLRGGPVARGGLRWSDRMEDFRTEVLDLVKAQMVKNAIIVPTGAKGGFVCRSITPESATRDEVAAEGVAVYEHFINALLDITDNLKAGTVIPPTDVVRHDEDDPYLVVAADKGTATFSDRANAIAVARGFWLGDAFASGGSNGYDHKKLGITSKGTWETAKIRFSELGVNWQQEPFTAVGIGDMGGDVFGNGSLLMPNMRLLAAFDHRHIFVDPTPDVAAAYAERKRLFNLPRSSWDDYQRELISKGGGIWSRQARSITLSAAARAALGTEHSKVTPDELARIILQAPVTVLYNGGIGTFIKSSDQSHEDARDRTNDSIRVNAADLRCRLAVEGGNLGMTQKARIEFASRGGLVYTDAIDNSAGVDCSDHEVNLKILLDQCFDGDLSNEQRNQLLASMAGDVERLVLKNNSGQARRLARETRASGRDAGRIKSLLVQLEQHSTLDRKLENLPNNDTVDRRAALGTACLVLPELSVVLAYAKSSLKASLVGTDHLDRLWSQAFFTGYFPKAVQSDKILSHPLRHQITSTLIANECVNRAGLDFAHGIASSYGVPLDRVLNVFAYVYTAFGLNQVCERWDDVICQSDVAHRDDFDRTLEEMIETSVIFFLNRPRYLTANGWKVVSQAVESSVRAIGSANASASSPAAAVQYILGLNEAVTQITSALKLITKQESDPQATLTTLRLVSEETGLQQLIALLEVAKAGSRGSNAFEFAISALRRQVVYFAEHVLRQSAAANPVKVTQILTELLQRMGFGDMRAEIARLQANSNLTSAREELAYHAWQLAERLEEARESYSR
ncbi:MAG: NAD-glutamate dehydrogenase [Gammaproteobacteria bacterium]|nr:NAD-glutamate dehydrogenase [Gammaproteobacteria bacterium]